MIEHLKGREQALAPLGWTGREAEWIALVCLHSGVFTRPQFCRYFDADEQARRHRFVKAIIGRRVRCRERVAGDIQRRREDHAGYPSKPIYRSLWKLKTSGTGGKAYRFRSSGGGFSRLILSWNIRA